ncbi:hypothetical protein J6590_051727 [Homalodisca vitripennis]|nr:hypothetical protein J6590_051727 [Homalodisca vitripennis]
MKREPTRIAVTKSSLSPVIPNSITTSVANRLATGRAFTERILSSNEDVNITSIQRNVKVIKLPREQGPPSKRITNLALDRRIKRCIVQINNDEGDYLCGPWAVVVALTCTRTPFSAEVYHQTT